MASFAGLALAALGLYSLRDQFGEAHVAMVFLLVVLGASAAGGRLLGITIALVAFLVFDWFFLPPFHALQVRNPLDWVVLLAFLITSGVAAQLLYRARAERAAVERVHALHEADQLKDALLAAVSHDLRTPLTTIKALAHELQSHGDERSLIIEEQADRLNRLVTDLLDAGRLNGGSLSMDIQMNAVDDLLGALSQQFAGRQDCDRLRLSLDDPATLSVGRFDLVHSLRILGNLVDNAFRYSPAGSPIEVTGGADRDAIVIRVADRGPGIDETQRSKLFIPFFRSPNSPRADDSTGLGLSIARRLAEAQGGTLEIASRDGGGTIFELKLPAATV